MSLPKFIYIPVEKDGRIRQVKNGVVTSLNSPYALPNAPDGNQEISIGWERSETYKGNVRNFSLSLGYVTDGYKILANDFIKFGIDRELWLLVKRLTYEWDDNVFKEYYKQLYKGQFDFSTSEIDKGNFRFNINMMEGGLHRFLKARETTEYELPFDLDAKNVRMDGMFITGEFRWILPHDTFQLEKYPALYPLSNDNPIPGLSIFEVQKNNAAAPITSDTLEYFAQTTQDIAGVRLTGTLVNITYSFGNLEAELVIFNTESQTERLVIDLAPADPYPQNTNLQIDQTFDLLKGDRLFLRVGDAPLGVMEIQESFLTLSAKSKPLPSVISGFTLYDVGRKLTEKITGNADDFDSTLLANLVSEIGYDIILTSGDGVRGITGAALKTSWRDYYKFCDTVLMTRMNITDKIRIENRITAYQPPSVKAAVSIGTIKNLKVTPAIDQMYTSIKVGHQDQDVNDTNGKFDFNGWMVFTTPIKAIPDRQMDLQSPYKASPYEIEQTRANYEGKTTTDKETDNDVFALAVIPDATTSVVTDAIFKADGAPLAPGVPLLSIVAPSPLFRAGMKIKVTGSALNNGDFTIKTSTPWFFGQLITLNEPLQDETPATPVTVEIIEGQYYDLDRSITVDQLTNPDTSTDIKETVYNVPLSPKRMLLKHGPWLAGMLYGYEAEKLVFSTANRNKEMIAGGIVEKADVQISTLGTAMFLPKYFEFDGVSPVDMVAILDADPNPVFEFEESEGFLYNGFFYRGGIALNDLEEQTFKLLATLENDLLNLIP